MPKLTAVITGASKGIGLEIAKEFASKGFNIFLGGRDSEALEAICISLSQKFAISANYFAGDLSQNSVCHDFAKYAIEFSASIAVLVNNAGAFIPGEVTREPEETLENLMKINVYSAYYITRCLWDSLKSSPRSHVFNMCSIASVKSYASGGSYSITKHALLGLSRSLREEGKFDRINVTSIMPGATLTDSWKGTDLPTDRFMKPEDVAKMVYTAWEINESTCVEELLMRPLLGDI